MMELELGCCAEKDVILEAHRFHGKRILNLKEIILEHMPEGKQKKNVE